jgi:hypothetical protein
MSGGTTPPGSDELPVMIDDGETIVRALKTPAHYDERKGTVKNGAFRPAPGQSGISTMRQRMGDNFCKSKAREICGNQYVGLAVIRAGDIRSVGSTIKDSRDIWLGHADLDHGIVTPNNEPPDAVALQTLTERCRELKARCSVRKDSDANSDEWTGATLAL